MSFHFLERCFDGNNFEINLYMKHTISSMPDVRQLLRKQRIIHRYSQDYMAHKLGISQRTYSKVERGEIRLTFDRLLQIGEILN